MGPFITARRDSDWGLPSVVVEDIPPLLEIDQRGHLPHGRAFQAQKGRDGRAGRAGAGNEKRHWGKPGDVLKLDIDPKTHPAWTGQHRIVDSGGQVARFNKRFAGLGIK